MSSDHDATDLEVAILADGLCPLCLAADNDTLRAELGLMQSDAAERNEIMSDLRAEQLEDAKAALADIISAWEHSDGGGGGVESIATAIDKARALRDASDAEVAAATDSIMDKNETLYTRLAARSDEDKP